MHRSVLSENEDGLTILKTESSAQMLMCQKFMKKLTI